MDMFARSQGEPLLRKNTTAAIIENDNIRANAIQIERYEQMQLKRKCRTKAVLVILTLLCITGFLTWLYIDHTVPEFNQYRLVQSFEELNSNNSTSDNGQQPRIILLWNTFFGDERWSLPDDLIDPSYFHKELQCPVSNCVLTNKRDLFPQLQMYDAILFHTAQPFSVINSVPSQRNPRQLYVFALMEPPGETKHILSDERNFYNLTMTYRTDSDIIWAYNWFVDKETGMRILPTEYPKWRPVPNIYNDTAIWKLWPNKTKMAAWFVSHCETLSKRERLTAELQKHMEVDVYGKCGPMSCPNGSPECDKMLDEKYKFYFSFENSLCIDYITEKLYKVMKRNIIPVVFGGANYKQFLPPHSYINVEDFATPSELADYLQYLAKNPIEYMRYFWWRQHYELRFYSPFCELCQRLHQPQYYLKTQSYSDIEKWWLKGSCRFKSRIKF
ncbi:alpha-(1,3)-fucosyltransferase C [Musca autumnalis]|uniref:alpha-(1,3)-fucosyltransferase C n=1 Tax=Musca autumnalis TaxID=221902 RepID=UPI003CF816FA